MASVDDAMEDCKALVAAHVAEKEVPTPGSDAWSVRVIMGECRRKTQNYLQTHVHDSRASSHWPSEKTPLSQQTDEQIDKIDRRNSLKEPDASEWPAAFPASCFKQRSPSTLASTSTKSTQSVPRVVRSLTSEAGMPLATA